MKKLTITYQLASGPTYSYEMTIEAIQLRRFYLLGYLTCAMEFNCGNATIGENKRELDAIDRAIKIHNIIYQDKIACFTHIPDNGNLPADDIIRPLATITPEELAK